MATESDSKRFLRATPVLMSGDYPRSRAFYERTLGFSVAEEGGDPPRFGIFARDQAVLFVNAWEGAPTPNPAIWNAYLHVSEIDGLFDDLQRADAPITRPIEDTVYGMREFEVTDPDGNVICFGEDTEKAKSANR